MQKSVTFESLEAGQTFTGPGRTLTETDHSLFMMLVGDWHQIHSDDVYAKGAPFGRRVMHGTFGIALAMGMQDRIMHFAEPIIGALGVESWVFAAPLFIGDTVHVEVEIVGKRRTSSGQRGIVQRKITLVNHENVAVQHGRADLMLALD